MLRLAIVVDVAIAPAVRKSGLPRDIVLREIDFSNGVPPDDELTDWEVEYSRRADARDGSLMLGVILAAAPGNHDGVVAERIRSLLPEHLQSDGIFFVSRRFEASLRDWCWQRICVVTTHLLREYARSHLALAGYREREQRLERSLALAEAAFVDFRKEPLKLGLRMAPSGVYVRPAERPSDAPNRKIVIRQRVPVLLANVVYVDIFFNREGAPLVGKGRLTVAAAYSETLICDSRFEFTEIRQSWNRFFCSADDMVLRQPLVIELELVTEQPVDMMPALSAPSPIAEECAFIVEEGSAGRPLALQIWCGIAGIRYPRHANVVAPAKGSGASDITMLSVPADIMSAATPYAISRRDLDFAPVSYDAETQSVLVHPLGRLPTVARLSGLRVNNLKSVSALVQLRHFDARPTDCAIMVVRSSDRPPRLDGVREQDERVVDGMNWLHLLGGEWGEVRVELADRLSGDVDIYLITRNQGDDFDLSWAFFRGVQLACQI